jgi:hypothetical protein
MAQFEVSYQLGQRQSGSGSFISENAIWYRMTVDAFSLTLAQRQVESMMGGPTRCLIGPTYQKSS